MEILRSLEGMRTPSLDSIMGLITSLGEETVLLVVMCAIYWCFNKRNAYVIAIAYFFSALTVNTMKILFKVERPWIIDPTLNPVPMAIENATGYSFPSGHTQSAAALFGTMAYQGKRIPYKLLLYALMLVIGFSRMYLGVHTIFDVLMSLIITMIIVMLADALYAQATDEVNRKKDILLPLAIVIFAVTVTIVSQMLLNMGEIEAEYIADCFKVAGVSIGFAIGMYIEREYIDFPIKTKSFITQFIKLILGVAGIIAIKEGFKLLLGTGPALDLIRYSLISLWITIVYPLIIKAIFGLKVIKLTPQELAELRDGEFRDSELRDSE